MKQNFTQRLEMQIPHENTYSGLRFMVHEKNLNDFLKKHYDFPSNNLDEINDFIKEDIELEKMVCELPDNISREIVFNKISFDFMKETDPMRKYLK